MFTPTSKHRLLYDYIIEGFTAITSLHFMRFDVCQ